MSLGVFRASRDKAMLVLSLPNGVFRIWDGDKMGKITVRGILLFQLRLLYTRQTKLRRE